MSNLLASSTVFSENADKFNDSIGLSSNLQTPRGIISTILPILLTLSGLVLFAMLISGGFSMLTSATNPDQASAGKQRITTAIIGFIILFASYWIIQILEIVLGINILGS